jgi:hypothetical protein
MDEPNRQSPSHRSNRRFRGWILGAVLIILGLLLLLQNFVTIELDNWWALLILLPAVGAFARAWDAYLDSDRRLTRQVRKPLLGGMVLVGVAAVFLLGLDWFIFFPALLILAGIGVLLNAMLPE